MLTPCGAQCAKRPAPKNSGRQYQNKTSPRIIIWPKLKSRLRKLSLRNRSPKRRPPRRRSNGKHSLLILPKQPPGFRAAVLFCRFSEVKHPSPVRFLNADGESGVRLPARPDAHRETLITKKSEGRLRFWNVENHAGRKFSRRRSRRDFSAVAASPDIASQRISCG